MVASGVSPAKKASRSPALIASISVRTAGSVTSAVMVSALVPGGVRGGVLARGPRRFHGPGRVAGRVDGRAGHEHVRPGIGAPLDGLVADSAVDLQPHR